MASAPLAVTVESRLTPRLTFPLADEKGQPSGLVRFLRPRVTLITPLGPVVAEPAGPPTPNLFPLVAIVGGLLVFGLVRRFLPI